MSNESYLMQNGWIPGSNPKWYRHLSLTGGDEAYETSAMKLQRSYDEGFKDGIDEAQATGLELIESDEKDEVMSKIIAPFTVGTTGLSSEWSIPLPKSDYSIKLCCKHGKPSVMLERGGLVVNRYDTVVEALSRAYSGSYVDHMGDEKYSVTPKKPEPTESDEEFILRHMWWKTSNGLWVHDDVRHADGDHVAFLHQLNAASVQRAINRAAEKAVADQT